MATLGRSESFQGAAAAFRTHLPDLSSPRFTTAKQQTAHEYSAAFQENHVPPWLYNLTETWKGLLEEPFTGVTSDGTVRPDLFPAEDMGIDIDAIKSAVENFLSQLSPEQKSKVQYPLAAKEWRCWSNPEFYLRPFGLRLEEIPENLATAVLRVIEVSFGPEGYAKALAAMRINHFLGEVCEVPKIMNKYSYNFLVFGTPSTDKAWGWSLYGHHLCLNVFLKGTHIVVSPTFTGAEPNIIDAGPHAGTAILHTEGNIGLELMQSLTPAQQKKAVVFPLLRDPGMLQSGDLKVDRWNQDDQRHLCGAFRDNRVVPYEGVLATDMTSKQQDLILDIVEQFTLYLPSKARELRKERVRKHLGETYFSWIGAYEDDSPFYYRVQSPVIICEFDHHSGVFLTNTEPAKFHTHTILRTPNGGDYGNALRDVRDRVP